MVVSVFPVILRFVYVIYQRSERISSREKTVPGFTLVEMRSHLTVTSPDLSRDPKYYSPQEQAHFATGIDESHYSAVGPVVAQTADGDKNGRTFVTATTARDCTRRENNSPCEPTFCRRQQRLSKP